MSNSEQCLWRHAGGSPLFIAGLEAQQAFDGEVFGDGGVEGEGVREENVACACDGVVGWVWDVEGPGAADGGVRGGVGAGEAEGKAEVDAGEVAGLEVVDLYGEGKGLGWRRMGGEGVVGGCLAAVAWGDVGASYGCGAAHYEGDVDLGGWVREEEEEGDDGGSVWVSEHGIIGLGRRRNNDCREWDCGDGNI